MRTLQYFFLMLFGIAAMCVNSYGQAKPADPRQKQREQRNFYRKTLQVDSVKAEQVSQVQDNYKKILRSIIADTSLNEAARRARIQVAIDEKNQKLRTMLRSDQQRKIIPSTELTQSSDLRLPK